MSAGILLLGGGSHCRAVIDVLRLAGVPVAGIVHGQDAALESVDGILPVGRDDDLAALRKKYTRALVAVGQIKSPRVRQKLFAALLQEDFDIPSVVSPLAYAASSARMGSGTIVMHHALVNAGAVLGDNCIINTRALVEHDCVIGSHCHIAVGAILCGGVVMGDGTFIGAGAIIREGVHIGPACVIGCGVTVLHEVPAHTMLCAGGA